MQEQLEDFMDEIGIPSNLIGYQYWIDAMCIAKVIDNGTYKVYMERIYKTIANKYHVSRNNVERCLRTARDKSNIKVKGNQLFLAELLKLYNRRYK